MMKIEKKTKLTIKERVTKLKGSASVILKTIVFFSRFSILLFFVFWAYVLQPPTKKMDKEEEVMKKKKRKRIKVKIKIDFIRKAYNKIYMSVLKRFDSKKPGEVKNADLIFLAMRNLATKKNRTFVTIGGMAIGFGSVILLLSVGYGFERLVISKVASLSEMQQIEVTTSQGSPLSFDTEVIDNIAKIEGVEDVIPTITSVSKVEYNNAISDVIGYGVIGKYFEETGLIPIKGEFFKEEDPVLGMKLKEEDTGVVAGASSTIISTKSMGQEIYQVRYAIYPLIWKPVYENPDTSSRILGYTKRDMGKQEATEVWGSLYDGAEANRQAIDIDGKNYRCWIKDSFPVWSKEDCKVKDPNCVDGKYVVLRNGEKQAVEYGFISEKKVDVERYLIKDSSGLEAYTGKIVDEVNFELVKGDYTTIYMEPAQNASAITVLEENGSEEYTGQLIYGGYYDTKEDNFIVSSTGGRYSYWIKAKMPVWGQKECDDLCTKYYTSENENADVPIDITVYMRAIDINIRKVENEALFGTVLGAQDSNSDNPNLVALDDLIEEDDDIDWVTISEEIGTIEKIDTDIKMFPETAQKVAVVNLSMLNLLGIATNEAIGEVFNANFIYDSKLFNKSNYLVESEVGEFTIVAVVNDSKTPAFYVPFNDIRVEGLSSASNLKVVLENQKYVAKAREKIEGLGFQTSSVVDTVGNISNLFHSLRIVLLILGLIALGVASLGMFNTLTVSLLEKIREVGLLKTMGLKSEEVKILFLAESIIMSISGGLAGLILGFLVGKILSALLSMLAISQGQGILNITYIPFALGAALVFSAAVVGVGTGWYPAEQATKISALNALRYE